MKLAIITPIPYLNRSLDQSDFYMVLGHLLKDKTYKKFYSDLKKTQPNSFILCDNSANEGYMLKGPELIGMAESINANELIAPDKYHDADVTLSETFSFLDEHYEKDLKGKFQVMAVPQGKDIDEYQMCYDAFSGDPRINTIGVGYRNLIPALMNDVYFATEDKLWDTMGIENIDTLIESLEDNCFNYTMSRLLFLYTAGKFRRLKRNNKQIHLLGLYNPYELKLIHGCLTKSELSVIRSCDSAAPWQAAQSGVRFHSKYGVITKPKAFLDFKGNCDLVQLGMVEHNWKLMKQWAQQD